MSEALDRSTKRGVAGRSFFDPSGAEVLRFARRECAADGEAAIATLVAVEGSSPRSPGAQMAIAEDGRFVGSISSGCLERAIVDEARAAIARGRGDVARYGKDSRFLDIVLPCGSGVDILYTVGLSVEALDTALDTLDKRRVCALAFEAGGVKPAATANPGWRDGVFTRLYAPALKIVAAGVGAELILLSRLAKAAGHDFCAISPDKDTLDQCVTDRSVHLQSTSSAPDFKLDPWSAYVSLFHDRDWELALMEAALASPAFYIGAVGGRKTAAARRDALDALGLSDGAINRLKAPVGVVPATRDPSALAISVLAEIIASWPG